MRFLLRPEALRLALVSGSWPAAGLRLALVSGFSPDAALLSVLISCSRSDEVWCLVLSSRSNPAAGLLLRFPDELPVALFTGLSADFLIELSAELRLSLSGSVLVRLLFGELELSAELRPSLWATVLERLLFTVPSDVLRFLAELPAAFSVAGSVF